MKRVLAVVFSLVVGCLALAEAAPGAAPPKKARPRKVVLIAGPLDKGHPRGTHEYEKSVRLLKHCLDHSPDAKGVRAEAHLNGWPADPRTLDDADTIVLISSGADRREADHPLLVGDRLAALDKQMQRGCGLVLIHWSVFVPRKKAGDKMLEWVGGYFDYESGPGPRGWYSKITVATTTARPASPKHPLCAGLVPFKLREEYYHHVRFRDKDERRVPVLVTPIPGEKADQVVAWAVERKDGGRGFGFTGGHFFDNWKVDNFRKMVLNAVVWTAKGAVPAIGVRSTAPTEAELAKVVVGKGPPERPIALAEGKFGKALNARVSPVVLPGSDAYRRPPLTVECWAKLNSRRDPNVLVACDPKASAEHWELHTYPFGGAFSAYLPGREPSEIKSPVNVADGKWHYLAMTFDGKVVRLYVDGKLVKEQAVKPRAGLKSVPGSLTVGMAVDGPRRVGCDGVIDDVRVSRVARAIKGAPAGPLPEDPGTLGVWRFDEAEGLRGDPDWTPPPVLDGEPWERYTDIDWVDGRLRLMDTGPTFNATVEYPSWKGKVRVYKATAIRIGDDGQAGVVFDRNTLRLAAGWTGGFLHHKDRRFGLTNTPTPAGAVAFTSRPGPGWADAKGGWDSKHPPTAPLPRDWGRYQGLYLHGRRAVLAYAVGGVGVLESPWAEASDGLTLLTRTVQVAPSKSTLKTLICELPADGEVVKQGGVTFVAVRHEGAWTAVALAGGRASLALAGKRRVEVSVPAGADIRRFKVLLWHGRAKDLTALAKAVKASPAPADLTAWTKPGPARWTKPVVTKGEVAKDDAPYVVDTLTVPYDNPYKALMFLSGVDFLPKGDLAVSSVHGDVWRVKGAGAKLDKLTWKRFATGLYQPLGLKVVDGQVVVLERGQLTRLHDLDGDGEADFYENINHDWHTGAGEHSFDTCLETDPAGNYYFFKTGDTHLPHGGCLLRVPKDGAKVEVFATGFRHPIGMSVSPAGVVTGADQEGNYMPATRIDVYAKGGFYGDLRAHHRDKAPATFDPPLLWLPRQADNSAGGQVWVPHDKFGLPKGQLLHLSYGRCKLFAVLQQEVGGRRQGGAVDLGLLFLSGAMRGRFGPDDGHLYVAGMNGWQTAARRDGCLQRVRYTGRPVPVPVGLAVHADGLRLTFAQKLDPDGAKDVTRYTLEQWNYRWSAEYGSKRWSVADPKREGQDTLKVESATLEKDGRSVFLTVRGLKPVMQMRIAYDLRAADGKPLAGTVYNTIHTTALKERSSP